MVPVAPIITGITLAFTFHMRFISIVRSYLFISIMIIIIIITIIIITIVGYLVLSFCACYMIYEMG
jgi:hypothetical protein